MKKYIFIIILVGMIGWAVYDFIASNNSSTSTADDDVVEQEESDEDLSVGLEVGNLAPDFQLKNLNGEHVALSDYRGSRVMINFWATWCPPCRAEMPDMEEFYQDKDIVILAINLTETETSVEQVEEFKDDFGLTFPILLDEQVEVASTYAIQPIPTTFMVDSNGVISYKALGAMNYDLMVQEFEKME